MRVLFDQATPLPFRAYLDQHSVSTASQQGWDKLKNGDLPTAAENAGFEVFLTTDKNIRYQQDLTRRKIAIVVLARQQWPQLRAHVQIIVEAVNKATLGSYMRSTFPQSSLSAASQIGAGFRRPDDVARSQEQLRPELAGTPAQADLRPDGGQPGLTARRRRT